MDLISGLQTFIRVVETGSFSAVAREANTSQSAVTRQVAQLEEHFGVRLFHRTTRKLSLTDEGQDLWPAPGICWRRPRTWRTRSAATAARPPVWYGSACLWARRSCWCRTDATCCANIPACRWNWSSASRWTIWWRSAWIWRCASGNRRTRPWCRARSRRSGRAGRRTGLPGAARRAVASVGPGEARLHHPRHRPDSTHWAFSGPDGTVDVDVTARSAPTTAW